jgi:hypothetical protein
LLAELGLDIQEAHAFSTIDGYSLDVFVVTGWHLGVWSSSLLHYIIARIILCSSIVLVQQCVFLVNNFIYSLLQFLEHRGATRKFTPEIS